MAKFYGKIGYAETVEVSRGVYEECITEREYYCELVRNVRNLQASSGVNDNVTIANDFSIVSDPYADANFHSMRYIEFMGAKWKISKVEVQYPRLILTTGGLYND